MSSLGGVPVFNLIISILFFLKKSLIPIVVVSKSGPDIFEVCPTNT